MCDGEKKNRSESEKRGLEYRKFASVSAGDAEDALEERRKQNSLHVGKA